MRQAGGHWMTKNLQDVWGCVSRNYVRHAVNTDPFIVRSPKDRRCICATR